MESELVNANHLSGLLHRLLPSLGPVLLISIGYVDPGKWAAAIEGGARFGFDLLAPVLGFNFIAIFCQYLSARIGLVTGKDLAQICRDEYDKWTCMFLGVQTMLSVIALDLTMILGIAHGLNLLLGVDLSTCVFLTAVDAVFFPLFATFLEKYKANVLCTLIAGSVLLLCFFGVLISQNEVQLSMNGVLTRLNEESAYALMSLLGASIMPHNFYLHSSVVLQHQAPPGISMGTLCQHHFFAILCIFSGICLVNYVLMNSASNAFHNTGLVLLTFPDAMSLVEQVFRGPVAPIAFLLILYITNLITALTWNLHGQVVLRDFLGLDIPCWLQRATIRIIAIAPALFCVWTSGVEGLYQLLVFTQVIVAVLLPSSVIPLFRVACSQVLMGSHRISQILEFLAIVAIMGMLGLKIIFVVEMIFGDSDWIGNLRWNVGSSSSVPYIVLLVTACLSLCLMLWLAATPLRSATQLDAPVWSWDVHNAIPNPSEQREENLFNETRHGGDDPLQKQELSTTLEKFVETYPDPTVTDPEFDLPETIMESDEHGLTTIEEDQCDFKFPGPLKGYQGESTLEMDTASVPPLVNEVADDYVFDAKTVQVASTNTVGKIDSVAGDLPAAKDDDEGDNWEPEELSKVVPGSASSLTSDGPPSLRSLSGKSDEGGNGAGSLSRLAGLGRAARRQFAAVLDDFWGQLYDLHGLLSPEAKTKKLDLLWADTRFASYPSKSDSIRKEFTGYPPSMSNAGSDPLVNPSLCQSPKQPRMQNNIDSSYGVQRGSYRSNHMQLLDAYVQGSSCSSVDSTEWRYSSLRSLPSCDGWENQPATIHGYQITSIVNRLAKDTNSNYLNGRRDSPSPLSSSLVPSNYRDSHPFLLGKNLQRELNPPQASEFQNLVVSNPLQSERSYYDVYSPGTSDSSGMPANTKKYHSLPDISGLSGPYKDVFMSEKGTQWDNSAGFESAIGRTSFEPSFYSNTGSRVVGSLAFNDLSKGYGDPFSFPSDSGSIWSKQPFEQIGGADKSRVVGAGIGSSSNSLTKETLSLVVTEAWLLQSFRCCILKLLKLEGSDWLFRQSDGTDEDLIDRVAARERFLYEAEMNRGTQSGEPQFLLSDRKSGSASQNDESAITNILVSSIPNCGEGCVYRIDLIVSFGVWCIHRILDFSLMESRPELWGKYTYVLNRLQGIIDPAFSKPRSPMPPCFCLQPSANGMLPPASKPGRGKCTTAAMLLDLIKDVEQAISCRKGRSGTAADVVAFSKGKQNLASVLKRYKRRLSKPGGGK